MQLGTEQSFYEREGSYILSDSHRSKSAFTKNIGIEFGSTNVSINSSIIIFDSPFKLLYIIAQDVFT